MNRKCLLCDTNFDISQNNNTAYGTDYCRQCLTEKPDLFETDQIQATEPRYDFEAELRFLPETEGGRKQQLVRQRSYKPDFAYLTDQNQLYMIWPSFVDDNGNLLARDTQVDLTNPIKAFMTIISDDSRKAVHQERIKPGLKFHVHEGQRVVAHGEVTKIMELNSA